MSFHYAHPDGPAKCSGCPDCCDIDAPGGLQGANWEGLTCSGTGLDPNAEPEIEVRHIGARFLWGLTRAPGSVGGGADIEADAVFAARCALAEVRIWENAHGWRFKYGEGKRRGSAHGGPAPTRDAALAAAIKAKP